MDEFYIAYVDHHIYNYMMSNLDIAIKKWTSDPFVPASGFKLIDSELKQARIELNRQSKYWSNTFTPLIQSGHLQSIIDHKYQYPQRIGLFAGMSCMFYCGFCGRNKNAAYDRNSLDAGIDMYKKLITDDPRNDVNWRNRFRISGGQEPLTNPRVHELVSHADQFGYKVSMYTNGYMLTPKLVDKQPGLSKLDSLRVSLYGYDDDSYHAITKKPNAWSLIRENIRKLQLADTRLGFNWIILPGKAFDYLRLIHALARLQDEIKRPIDFITVREDFSQDVVYINEYERKQLIDIFIEVERFAKINLPHTNIDYGYALDPLRRNQIIGPLRMANHTQLDGYGIPQASIQVDILGNIYVYHETAFLDRPGSNKFIIGNARDGIENVIRAHLDGPRLEYIPSDTEMLDAFDHAVSLAVWAARKDREAGAPSLFDQTDPSTNPNR